MGDIRHKKVLTSPSSGTEDKVYGADWNDTHIIEGNTVTDDMIAPHVTTKITVPVEKISGVLPYSKGGTGQSAWAKGDLLYASDANVLSRLPIGTGFLKAVSGLPCLLYTSPSPRD